MIKKLLIAAGAVVVTGMLFFVALISPAQAALSILTGQGGGTGFGTTTAGNIGNCLSVLSITPLKYTFSACSSSGGSGISSLGPAGQGQIGSTQTIATSSAVTVSGLTVGLTITSSGNTHTFTPNFSGTISGLSATNFTSANISQWTNNSGYLTAAGAVTSLAGTANQIAASAATGAVTLTLPAHVIFPGNFQVTNATTTNATTTGSQYFSGITASRPLYIDSTGKLGSAGSGTSGNCVQWAANNTLGDAGAACGSGTGGSFPFTPTSYGNSTTSIIGFTNGIISNASSTLNIFAINNLTSAGFVKTAAGTGALSVDTATYLTGNQTITLSGAVTGSGATAITTAFGTAGANTVLSNGTGATAIPTFIATSSLFQNSSATLSGLLTSTDWNTFNGKQAAGNYITALTGDVTASGPGSAAATLASIISASTCTNCNLTYDAKGRITVATSGSGGSGTFPFAADTNYGQVVYSTSTPSLWFKSGFFASSTSQIAYASTTAISAVTASSTNLVVSSAGGAAGCATFSANGTISNTGVACGSGGGVSSVTATYPILSSGGTTPVISTAFGTTTTWGIGNNGFIVAGATGIPFVAASSTLNLPNTALANSTISGVALGGSLFAHTHDSTLSGTSYNGSAAVSDWGINLSNSNVWTNLQRFSNASSTLFSNLTKAYFGATATTTIDSAGNVVVPSGSGLTITGKSDGCATFATGVLNSTGSACGGAGSTPGGSNTQLQYNDSSTFNGASLLTYDKTLLTLGIGTTTPWLANSLSIGSTTPIVQGVYVLATSTAMSLGVASSTIQHINYGTSAITITVSGYRLSPGESTRVFTCSPVGTGGAITWAAGTGATLHFAGGVQPGNTTQASACDEWFLDVGYGPMGSTTPWVYVSQAPGFQ